MLKILKKPISTQIGLDWLCYLTGNYQMAPTMFSFFQDVFLDYFTKNPQTKYALTFLTHNISAIGGVLVEKVTNLNQGKF